MKKQQKREQQKARRAANREGHLMNRKHWQPCGPVVIEDEPTEDHVKALLMEWVTPAECSRLREAFTCHRERMISSLCHLGLDGITPVALNGMDYEQLKRLLLASAYGAGHAMLQNWAADEAR